MERSLQRAIADFAPRQHGLVARWQLRAVGVPDSVVVWACKSGALMPYRYGVLRVPGLPSGEAQPILAACLAAGPDSVASHWAAGGLHRLKGVAAGAIEITVPLPRRARLIGVAVHHVRTALAAPDFCRVRGVPCTSVAKSLVDLAGTGLIWLVERAMDDAFVRDLCTPSGVAAALDRAGKRPGVPALRALLIARQGERADSHQELRWLRAIRQEIDEDPELHYKVVLPEGVFEIDIAWPRPKVGLEVNGWASHGTRSAFDHDARKGLLLIREGWHVGTVTSAMTERDVVATAKALLARYG